MAVDTQTDIVVPKDVDFAVGQTFMQTEQLAERGNYLIGQHFPDLAGVKIDYRWKKRGGQTKGKLTFGMAVKPGALLAHYTDALFVIWLAADHVRENHWTDREIEAALFHELCHCDVTEEGDPVLAPHDWEGFSRELLHYGPWRSDLLQLVDRVKALIAREE